MDPGAHDEHERLLLTGQVAGLLGLSVDRVRQLDTELAPERSAARGIRLYRLERVLAYRAAREQAQALRPSTPSE